MFNKQLRLEIAGLSSTVGHLEQRLRDAKDEMRNLRADHDRLIAALGLTLRVTNKIEYVKKGGPEKEPQ